MHDTNQGYFIGILFGLFQLISILSITPGGRPALKWIAFIILSWISYHVITKTTIQSHVVNYILGTVILTQLVLVFDMIFITDPDTLKNFQDSHSGKITERPFKERVLWALNLYTNPRGIGWAHESPLPSRPSPTTPRWKFVGVQVIRTLLFIAIACIAQVFNSSNPGLTTRGVPLSHSALKWRVLGVAGFGVAGYAQLNLVHCLFSVVLVACGFSAPERWPNVFESPLLAWSVQQFWSKMWHQMLRKLATSYATFITSKIIRSQTRTHGHRVNLSNFVQNSLWLFTAFSVGGFTHMGGETMVIGRMGGGAFKFFVLQSAAIILEKVVASGWAHFNSPLDIDESDARMKRRNGRNRVKSLSPNASKRDEQSRRGSEEKSDPPIWLRCVGYAWVILWFVWSLAFMIDPLASCGMFIDDDFVTFARSLL